MGMLEWDGAAEFRPWDDVASFFGFRIGIAGLA